MPTHKMIQADPEHLVALALGGYLSPEQTAEILGSIKTGLVGTVNLDGLKADAIWYFVRKYQDVVAGPWVPANGDRVSVHRGIWRFGAGNKSVAEVRPSTALRKPEPWEFLVEDEYDEDDEPVEDWDAYEEAMSLFRVKAEAWKPWSYSVVQFARGYAASREEAIRNADAALRTHAGILYLVDGPIPPDEG